MKMLLHDSLLDLDGRELLAPEELGRDEIGVRIAAEGFNGLYAFDSLSLAEAFFSKAEIEFKLAADLEIRKMLFRRV